MAVPYTFANATVSIPLSQLDSNFATAITLGNTAIQLGNTVTTLNNMTLANVTVSSGNATFTTANVTNMSSGNVTITGGTIANVTISGSGSNITATNINASNVTVSTDLTLSGGTANGVAYLNGSKVLTTGSALTFDGTNLGVGGAPSVKFHVQTASGYIARFQGTTPNTGVDIYSSTGVSYVADIGVNNGWQFGTTGYIAGIAGNSEQMRLTSTGLGIGTSSPSEKLDVRSSGNAIGQFVSSNASGYAGINTNNGSRNWYAGIRADAGNGFGIRDETAGATRLLVDSSGNLGLGVTPSAWATLTGFDITTYGSVYAYSNQVGLTGNAYYNSGWKYKLTGSNATYYSQSAGQHIWQTAPSGTAGNAISFTQAMTLDASGNLGIGTSSPSNRLTVIGPSSEATNLLTSSTNAAVLIRPFSGSSWATAIGSISGQIQYIQGVAAAGDAARDLVLQPYGGNVGIGTSSPGKKLDVYASGSDSIVRTQTGSTSGLAQIEFRNTQAGCQIGMPANVNAMNFITADTERMRIDSSGNVGIGTSSPSSITGGKCLTVYNTGYSTVSVQAVDGNNDRNATLELLSSGNGESYSQILYGDTDTTPATKSPLVFAEYYSGIRTERIRIDSSGNLLVGTTSNTRAARLRVEGQETAYFTGYGNGFGIGLWMTPNASATGGTATAISFQNVSNTTVGSISTTGSATTYSTSSDYRLKENIQPMQNALATVAQLNPVTYTWKADGSDGQGFIAHELQAVVPDCVTGEKDAVDADGKPVYQGIDTSFLVATLTAAIKELKAELDATKAEVAALKGN